MAGVLNVALDDFEVDEDLHLEVDPPRPMTADEQLEVCERSLVEQAKALEIKTADAARAGAELLDAIAGLRKQIAEHHDPTIRAAHATHKAALAAKAKLDDPLKEAEGLLRRALGSWEQAERDRAELERCREQERLASLAKAAEEAGDHDRAAALAMAPATTPEPEPVMASTAKYEVAVTDLAALVAAVAKGDVPLGVLEPNVSAIRKAAEAVSGDLKWPGVTITKTRSVRRTRK